MDQGHPAAIRVERLWKRFRKAGHEGFLWEALQRGLRRLARGRDDPSDMFWALQDINLEVRRGEAVGIIGPNGAGKSTLLKVLSRVLRPDRGRVLVQGRLSGLIELGAGFHGDLTGRENIFVNGAILGMSRREIHRKFDRIVEFSGLGEFLDMPVKRYSSGMYVRLGFSIAAQIEPDVLLVDEVLSVGDVQFKARCREAMRGFLRRGTSILFVSHNLGSVKRICDRVLLLHKGRVLCEGSPDEAILAYSQLVTELEQAHPAGMEELDIGGRMQARGPAAITGVRILDTRGRPTQTFKAGETLCLEIDYQVDPAGGGVEDLNFTVAVHMFGAGLCYEFQSRADGLRLGRCTGAGTVGVELNHLTVNEGVYQISVALADDKGLPEHDWHDRAYRFNVITDGRTGGCMYQARNWRVLPEGAAALQSTAIQPDTQAGRSGDLVGVAT